jgi:sporulation protein YlmC with PRC-barrel domain
LHQEIVTERFIIGAKVECTDGVCGDLRRVVVDPVAKAITHLVVEPRLRRHGGRLVPVHLVASAGDEIHLSVTKDQFHILEEADEKQLLPGAEGEWGVEQDDVLSLPYYGLGMSPMGAVGSEGVGMGSLGAGIGVGPGQEHPVVTGEHVPVGEVEVRRGEPVHATDGAIGRVRGLVIDPANRHVTHFLLDEGHRWGSKRVAIPIGAVTSVDDGVRVNLTQDQVRDLPPVELEHED